MMAMLILLVFGLAGVWAAGRDAVAVLQHTATVRTVVTRVVPEAAIGASFAAVALLAME